MNFFHILIIIFTLLFSQCSVALISNQVVSKTTPQEAKDLLVKMDNLIKNSIKSGINENFAFAHVFVEKLTHKQRELYTQYYFHRLAEDLFHTFKKSNQRYNFFDRYIGLINFSALIDNDDYNNLADYLIMNRNSIPYMKYLVDKDYIDLSIVSAAVKELIAKAVIIDELEPYVTIYQDELIQHGYGSGNYRFINKLPAAKNVARSNHPKLPVDFVKECLVKNKTESHAYALNQLAKTLKRSFLKVSTRARTGLHMHVVSDANKDELCNYYFEFGYETDEEGGTYIHSLTGEVYYVPHNVVYKLTADDILNYTGLNKWAQLMLSN